VGLTLVAEHSTPSGLAVALPGSVTGAVDAAGVGVALVTVLAPPSSLAPALARFLAVATVAVASVGANSCKTNHFVRGLLIFLNIGLTLRKNLNYFIIFFA